MTITELFGESTRMKVVEFFMDFPKDRFTVSELVEGIGMSRTTAFDQVKELLENEWIVEKPKVGKSPTYQINFNNPIVKTMQKINSFESEKIAIKELQKNTFSSARKQIQMQLVLGLIDSELEPLSNNTWKSQNQRKKIIESINMKVAKISKEKFKKMEKEIEA